MKLLTSYNPTGLKALITIQVVSGTLKNMSSWPISRISHCKKRFMHLRRGSRWVIASRCKNNMNRLWNSLHGQFSSVPIIHMRCHCAGMNMYTMKTFPKLGKCLKAPWATTSGTTTHGGVWVISFTNKRSMTRQLKVLTRQLALTPKTQCCIHSWASPWPQADNSPKL